MAGVRGNNIVDQKDSLSYRVNITGLSPSGLSAPITDRGKHAAR